MLNKANIMKKCTLILTLIMVLMSCSGEKKKPIYLDLEEAAEESLYAQSGDEIVVPFRNENGVKYVSVKVNGITFARLSEDNLKEYKEKAETATALPTSQTDTSATGSTEENKKTEFTDTILLDNEYVTVELTQFFEKKVNWAGREPQIEKYITLKVHNNSGSITKLVGFGIPDIAPPAHV